MRKIHRTAQIKPATRDALAAQFAAAADGIIRERGKRRVLAERWRIALTQAAKLKREIEVRDRHIAWLESRRWWHRFAWWRK